MVSGGVEDVEMDDGRSSRRDVYSSPFKIPLTRAQNLEIVR